MFMKLSKERRSFIFPVTIILLLSTIFFLSCTQTQDYFTFYDEQYDFRVQVPGKYRELEKRTEVIDTSAGKFNMDFFIATGEEKVFMIGALRHGFPGTDEEMTRFGMEFASRSLAESAEILWKREITLNGYPALSLRYRKEQNGQSVYAHTVILEIPGTQYQLQVISYNEKELDEQDAVRFQMSFKHIESRDSNELQDQDQDDDSEP
ncbi:MAG: hypothetical protein DRP87_11780 [Spirochaetes bacterium]|nr:MAG: hypothetical protein DRP87_11780 [Spirochaetota bacterium]